jgi:hypothetical protein
LPRGGTHWESWQEGIFDVTGGLRRAYLNDGLTSVAAIQRRYCPVGASNDPSGVNKNWLPTITQFYRELGGNPNDVRIRGN